MTSMTFPTSSIHTNNPLEGVRLETFEAYNWGTFHDHIATINPRGQSSLGVGKNGAGKTTLLVDGPLNLLVPPGLRRYNQASGADKGDRSELTYIRGAWNKQE